MMGVEKIEDLAERGWGMEVGGGKGGWTVFKKIEVEKGFSFPF